MSGQESCVIKAALKSEDCEDTLPEEAGEGLVHEMGLLDLIN